MSRARNHLRWSTKGGGHNTTREWVGFSCGCLGRAVVARLAHAGRRLDSCRVCPRFRCRGRMARRGGRWLTRRGVEAASPPILGPSRSSRLRAPYHGSQGFGAAPLLRLGPANRTGRHRSERRAHCSSRCRNLAEDSHCRRTRRPDRGYGASRAEPRHRSTRPGCGGVALRQRAEGQRVVWPAKVRHRSRRHHDHRLGEGFQATPRAPLRAGGKGRDGMAHHRTPPTRHRRVPTGSRVPQPQRASAFATRCEASHRPSFGQSHTSTCTSTYICHSSFGRRCRFACCTGDVGPRRSLHHPDLHTRQS